MGKSFQDLGLSEELCKACQKLGWTNPTLIQKRAIPLAFQGEDVVGLAETGSGKTGAFGLPILQNLHQAQRPRLFALIIVPTRELAVQIREHLQALDEKLTCQCLVGGIPLIEEYLKLVEAPSILVATPGRLLEHLEKTKGFSLMSIKYLVIDEADRMLDMDFKGELDLIVAKLPKRKHTMLFSATMTYKVDQLKRLIMKEPAEASVSSANTTVKNLQQFKIQTELRQKVSHLASILLDVGNSSVIVFCGSRNDCLLIGIQLRKLGFSALPIYGKMAQSKRLATVEKFKSGERSILVATEMVARGIDIQGVDYVINYDVPMIKKEYIHRVGRTARAGKSGTAITLVSQYELEDMRKIEQHIKQKLEKYPVDKERIAKLKTHVDKAREFAKSEKRRLEKKMRQAKKKVEFVDRKKPKRKPRFKKT